MEKDVQLVIVSTFFFLIQIDLFTPFSFSYILIFYSIYSLMRFFIDLLPNLYILLMKYSSNCLWFYVYIYINQNLCELNQISCHSQLKH